MFCVTLAFINHHLMSSSLMNLSPNYFSVTRCLLDVLLDKSAESLRQNSATVILTMVAAVDPSVAEQNLTLLSSAGLASTVELARDTCKLFQEAATIKVQF